MYIDKNRLTLTSPAAGTVNMAQLPEEAGAVPEAGDNSPGFAPISPDTPSWGPPPGNDDSPGFAPISPDTPSWGPPSGDDNSPGFFPISPDTPSWGPPPGNGGGNGGSGGITGGIIVGPIVVPGRPICPGCSPGSQSANIRFLHGAVNQPAVNVQVGGLTFINHMQYGNVTPYYLDNANRNVQIVITSAQTGYTLYQGVFRFAGNTAYTLAIVNDGSGISLLTVTDLPCNARNSACLRAVNLSPNSGPVDIFLSGYGRIFQRVNQLSATEYRNVNQGSYRASVSEALPCAGNSSVIVANEYVECNNTRIAIMDTAAVNLMAGVTYTLYIIGLAYQFPAVQVLPVESDLIY